MPFSTKFTTALNASIVGWTVCCRSAAHRASGQTRIRLGRRVVAGRSPMFRCWSMTSSIRLRPCRSSVWRGCLVSVARRQCARRSAIFARIRERLRRIDVAVKSRRQFSTNRHPELRAFLRICSTMSASVSLHWHVGAAGKGGGAWLADFPARWGFFLSDGGLETSLVFLDKIELPHFAAFALLADDLAGSA